MLVMFGTALVITYIKRSTRRYKVRLLDLKALHILKSSLLITINCEEVRFGVKDSDLLHFMCSKFFNVLGDFNEKVGKDYIFKPTIGTESLHERSNYNRVTIVKFVTSKICQECNVHTLQRSHLDR
jgi:hypothetical protein